MKLIKLSKVPCGRAVYVNPKHIVSVFESFEGGHFQGSHISFSNGEAEQVLQTVEEIMRIINGINIID